MWSVIFALLVLHTACTDSSPRFDVFFTYLKGRIEQNQGILGNGRTPLHFIVDVNSSPQSRQTIGSNLWKLSFYGSENEGGRGPQEMLSEQLLDVRQSSQTLRNGPAAMRFESNTELDLRNVGPFTTKPFLCLRMQKTDTPSVDFTANVITACSRVQLIERRSRLTWREDTRRAITAAAASLRRENVPRESRVSLTHIDATITQTESIRGNGKTPLRFVTSVISDVSSDRIAGSNLWRLSMFGCTNRFGSGEKYILQSQLLNEEDRSQTLQAGIASLNWEFEEDIDLSEVGPFTRFEYICLRIQKGDNPSIEFSSNELTACNQIRLTERTSQRSWQQQTQRAIQRAQRRESRVPPNLQVDLDDDTSARVFQLGAEDHRCGFNRIINYCGSACPPSCEDLDGDPNCDQCTVTCDCPEGFVTNGSSSCIEKSECGCNIDGQYIEKGDTVVNSECTTSCTCQGGGIYQCRSISCGRGARCESRDGIRDCYCPIGFSGNGRESCQPASLMCQVFGDPHYVTFDSKKFTFQGNCSYTLTKPCTDVTNFPQFEVIGYNIRRNPGEDFTFQRGIELVVDKRSYKIAYKGDVTVDGVSVTDYLPRKIGPVKLSLKPNGAAELSTTFGVVVTYDGKNDAEIYIPLELQTRVCGLCGNADGNVKNDFTTSTGAEVRNVNEFADSWARERDCRTPETQFQCAMNTRELAYQTCDPIQSDEGPFAFCHEYVNPQLFFFSCMYDYCATDGSPSAYCDSVSAYIDRCKDSGVGDTTGLNYLLEDCYSGECPALFEEFEGSCYRFYSGEKLDRTYKNAADFCAYRGAHLATIQSEEENNYITSLTGGVDAWIGGVRNVQQVTFRTSGRENEPNYKDINDYVTPGTRQLDVVVKASRDVIFVFTNEVIDEDQYVVVIGAAHNTRTQIKRCLSCDVKAEFVSPELSVNNFRRFQIRFDGGVVSVGRPGENQPFLSWTDDDPIEINYFGFMNFGSRALWRFVKDFQWSNGDQWTYQNFHPNEPSDHLGREDCLQTNFEQEGLWNDHFCARPRGFVCEKPLN